MCADGWDFSDDDGVKGVCPDCGEPTIDGTAITGCNYSQVDCKTCGASPCDGSC